MPVVLACSVLLLVALTGCCGLKAISVHRESRTWWRNRLSARSSRALPFALPSAKKSSYEETSSLAKGVVGGLTSLLNLLSPRPENEEPRVYKKKKLTPSEIKKGIVEDFRKGYLFSGEIEPEIYWETCTFTDPTLSFQGLSTFENNLMAISPALDRFLGDNACVLYSLTEDRRERSISTRWRMVGDIKLLPFWNPRLNLGGQTTFSYSASDSESGGRVESYYEQWDISAAEALLQLLGQPSTLSVAEIAEEEASDGAMVVNFYSNETQVRTVL